MTTFNHIRQIWQHPMEKTGNIPPRIPFLFLFVAFFFLSPILFSSAISSLSFLSFTSCFVSFFLLLVYVSPSFLHSPCFFPSFPLLFLSSFSSSFALYLVLLQWLNQKEWDGRCRSQAWRDTDLTHNTFIRNKSTKYGTDKTGRLSRSLIWT